MGFRTLYGGRHLRLTIALATTGVAAGAVTGAVGLGLAGTATAHDMPSTGHRATPAEHRHHTRPAPHLTLAFSHRPTATPTRPSPTATPTPTRSVGPHPSGTATTAPPTSPPPSAGSTSANSTSAPQGPPAG